MPMIGIGVGDATMGHRQIDTAGNIISETPAQWTENHAGGCVCLWPMDPETRNPNGPAEIFGDWDAASYLARVLEMIHPNRKINIPNLADIIKTATKDGVDLCEYCHATNCGDCIMNDWKGENDDE